MSETESKPERYVRPPSAESLGEAPGRGRLKSRRILIVGGGQRVFDAATDPIGNGRAMPGIDRLQMVVAGRGLVLKAPGQEFDEREPFTTVRFAGELEIVTALEAGPVEVVNLMARRGAAEIALVALREPGERELAAGTHLVYAVSGDCGIRLNSEDFVIPGGCTLKVELTRAARLAFVSGLAVLASIQLVG